VIGAVAAVAAMAGAPAVGSSPAVERAGAKTVAVEDDFFAPDELNIAKGTKVAFKWNKVNGNSHNVTLRKGPKGVKKGCAKKGKDAFSPLISKCNKSSTGAVGIKFTKKFDVSGTYDFLCTIHPDVMTITVKVKK
jgi:plastocyanin